MDTFVRCELRADIHNQTVPAGSKDLPVPPVFAAN